MPRNKQIFYCSLKEGLFHGIAHSDIKTRSAYVTSVLSLHILYESPVFILDPESVNRFASITAGSFMFMWSDVAVW